MPADNNFWGELVAQLRTDQGTSQRKLAERAGVDRTTLRRIEADGASGSIYIMQALLHHLGYELEAISFEAKDEDRRRRELVEADPVLRGELAMRRITGMTAW